jgi:DNA-binding HxlR family transcriptional regulator
MIDINLVRSDPAVAKVVQAEFRRAVGMISGRWKLEILWLLSHGTHRFGELKRGLPGITQHMLTAQLRALEKDGLIKRTIFAEVPPGWNTDHARSPTSAADLRGDCEMGRGERGRRPTQAAAADA